MVRLKVGSVLVDARGVSLLYRNAIKAWQIWLICLAAVIPLLAFFLWPTRGRQRLVAPLWLRIRVFLACKNVLGLKKCFRGKRFLDCQKGQSLMIIDLRYHIFSLAAVFLALGLGIAIGSALPGADTLLREQEKVITRLEKEFAQLRSERRALEEMVAEKEKELAVMERFHREIFPCWPATS